MSNEAAFLGAIRSDLHDDLPRLVYADWLEERGDVRHEYLRAECELVRTWGYTSPRHDLLAQLNMLRAGFDSGWVAQVRRCTTPAPPVDVSAVAPAFAKLARRTVRLHPRRGEAPVDASKIGGTFLWPAAEEWPRCAEHDCPFVGALQLRKEDVPEVGFKRGTDLVQLLWCPHDHEPYYCPDVEAYWWKRADIRETADPPSPTITGERYLLHLPRPCLLYPERVVEYPAWDELEDGDYYRLVESEEMATAVANAPRLAHGGWRVPDDASRMYQMWLSSADTWKVGGYPHWVQDPETPSCSCGAKMTLLVQCGSREFDGESWGRWLPIQDREQLTGVPDDRFAVQSAADVTFGDAGNLYVFTCRVCPARPIRTVMQCS